MKIEFEKLWFKNLMSFGANPVDLTFKSGFNLVIGPNGVGKSSFLLDSISYACFGKPYRKITLGELINRTNKKSLEISLQFSVVGKSSKDTYIIKRGMKPDILSISKNGSPMDKLSSKDLIQDEINKIIGIDYPMFKQIVSLAISYNKPFFSMEAKDKREVIEAIFNIKIFGRMLKNLKELIKNKKVEHEVSKQTVAIIEQNLSIMRKTLADMKRSASEFETNKENDIKNSELQIDSLNRAIEDYKKQSVIAEENLAVLNNSSISLKIELSKIEPVDITRENDDIQELEAQLSEMKPQNVEDTKEYIELENANKITIEEMVKLQTEYDSINTIEEEKTISANRKALSLSQISTLNYKLGSQKDRLKFYNENQTCNECGQKIHDDFKAETIGLIKRDIEQIENDIKTRSEEESRLNKEILDLTNKINEKSKNKTELQIKIQACISSINSNNQMKKKLLSDYNEKLNAQKREIENQITIKKQQIKAISDEYMNKCRLLEEKISSNSSQIIQTTSKIETYKNLIESSQVQIDSVKKILDEIRLRKCSINVEEYKTQFDEKCTEYVSKSQDLSNCEHCLKIYDTTSQLLSEDGIKSYFFKRLTPILNLKINEYLSKFDLPISVNFNEYMEGTINNIGNSEEISYNAYSEGEKKSIDTAILFSFIEVAKIVCNWSCNILMVDELIDGQIDSSRLEKAVAILKSISAEDNMCSFVISHRHDDPVLRSYFDGVVEIRKTGGFNGFSEINLSR